MTTVEAKNSLPRLAPDYHPHWIKLTYLPYPKIGRSRLFLPDQAQQKSDPAFACYCGAENIARLSLDIEMLGRRLEQGLKEQDAAMLVGTISVACWSIIRLQARMAPQLAVYRDHNPKLREPSVVEVSPADASARRSVAKDSFKDYGLALRVAAGRLYYAYLKGNGARLHQAFKVMELHYALLPELLTAEIERLRQLVHTDSFPEAFDAAFALLHKPATAKPELSEVSD